MFEEIATSWPLDLSADGAKAISLVSASSSLYDLAVAVRAEVDPVRLQSALLVRSALGDQQECEILLCCLAFNQLNYRAFDNILAFLREKNPSRFEIRVLTLFRWLWKNDLHAVATAPSDIWLGLQHSYLLQLCKADYYLKVDDLFEAEKILSQLPDCLCPELLMLQASLLAKKGDYNAAIERLLAHLHRCPRNIRYYRQLLDHMIEGKDAKNVMPCARDALAKFGEHSTILYHLTTLNLYKRQPGLAKRSALLQQVSSTVRTTSINLSNQLATYEINGQVDWLDFLSPLIVNTNRLSDPQLQENLVMQLASIQSDKYESHLKKLVSAAQSQPGYLEVRRSSQDLLGSKSSVKSRLNIGWLTGDCSYHPVARFLYGWFASCSHSLCHNHVLISLEDHRDESFCDLFRSISAMDVQDVSGFSEIDRLYEIRKNNYDVIVDLSGWTGGNFVAGLSARLAPVQVNYLGYFASSGLDSVDYWLGDSHLFPPGHAEWATESLWRLSRPFLAWTPQQPLHEADVPVATAPSGTVCFGSFNHNRKLSDATLRLWGQLLAAVPGSRLVLKASAQTDSDTQRLLSRRMKRQGLDPDRVEWLPLTKGPVEHMQQYAQVDIALDPIPNGGCTTTCEALWMGVPTITLAGSHYVSRMSTAVLAGANMPEWIAEDQDGYINLACEQAARVSELRANRAHWRRQLQSSKLGDAADLMLHLEDAFSKMNAEVLSRI